MRTVIKPNEPYIDAKYWTFYVLDRKARAIRHDHIAYMPIAKTRSWRFGIVHTKLISCKDYLEALQI